MPLRPALRPGAPLLRRDAKHLQVGTSPGIVITDRPGLLALLHLMDGARDVARLWALAGSDIPDLDVDVADVVRELQSLGAVFDASRWSGPGRPGLEAESRHTSLGGEDPASLRLRTSLRVSFHHDGGSRPLVVSTQAILSQAGVTDLDSLDPELLVIVSCGEPSRRVFDRPMLVGLDHLPVVVDEDRVRIGPFVRPGHTPCVGCHDQHRADWDHLWPSIASQLGRQTFAMTPPALSATATHAGALELAVEVLAHADGHDLRTRGFCLAVGPAHDARIRWPVPFHHRCACDLLNAA